MPNALTNTNISATYKGVLHTNGITIPPTGQEAVYDGVGVQSSLSVGRANRGVTVTGLLSANAVKAGELLMPNVDGSQNQVVARIGAGTLGLRSISELIGSGPAIENGVYDNPRITVEGNVITKIESRPTIQLLSTPTSLINTNVYGDGKYANVTGTTNFVINWTEKTGYYADVEELIAARYAIITVKLYLQSGSTNFAAQLFKDSIEIASGVVGSNDTENYIYLDQNRYIYMNQLIVNIPDIKTSIFEYRRTLGKTQPVRGTRLNENGFTVSLDGWVF